MPRKRIPSDEEISALANRFQALWRSGDVIRPWLRKHRNMVLELVHDEWSWAAIAKAFTQAGITYQTGRPWTAEWLRRDFQRSTVPLKGYSRGHETRTAYSAVSTTTVPEVPLTATAERPHEPLGTSATESISKPSPRFKPVSLKPFEPRPPVSEEELTRIEQNRILTFGKR